MTAVNRPTTTLNLTICSAVRLFKLFTIFNFIFNSQFLSAVFNFNFVFIFSFKFTTTFSIPIRPLPTRTEYTTSLRAEINLFSRLTNYFTISTG